jgi:quinol monooxygenase YgiN
MISVIAKIPLKEGKASELKEDIKALMQGVAQEDGTLFYTVSADKKAPDTLVFMERYKDKEALKAHSATPHFNAFMGKIMEALEGQPEITVLNELASAH